MFKTVDQISRLLSSIPFFEHLDRDALCKSILQITMPPGCVFIKQADKNANEMFILMEGVVNVYYQSGYMPKHDSLHHYANGQIQYTDTLDMESQSQYGVLKNTVSAYCSFFGEQAMIKDRPRMVTLITDAESHFLVLQREDVEGAIKTLSEARFVRRSILKNLFPDLFENGDNKVVKERLFRLFLWKQLVRNQVLTPSQTRMIYIVQSGDFALEIKDDGKQRCILSQIAQGTMIGEELLLNTDTQFRAICQSHVGLVICFNPFDPLLIKINRDVFQRQLENKLIMAKMSPPISRIQSPSVKSNKYQTTMTIFINKKKKLFNQLHKEDKEIPLIGTSFFQQDSMPRHRVLQYYGKSNVLLGFHNRVKKQAQYASKSANREYKAILDNSLLQQSSARQTPTRMRLRKPCNLTSLGHTFDLGVNNDYKSFLPTSCLHSKQLQRFI